MSITRHKGVVCGVGVGLGVQNLPQYSEVLTKLSRILDSQHNKFCCFLPTAAQLNTPVTSPLLLFGNIPSVPVQVVDRVSQLV
jgi:hypothetical protein